MLENRVKILEDEVEALKVNNVRIDSKIETLCEKVGSLTKVLWFFSTTIFLALITYFMQTR